MESSIKPDEGKLRELILYLAEKCQDDPDYGATKLNKLLYMIDAFGYAQLGQPVTGVEYMKQEYGPVPRRLVPVKKAMIADRDAVEVERAARGVAYRQKRLIALRPANLSMFAPEEIAHIDEIVRACSSATTTQLSALTHTWLGWKMARAIGDPIPYSAIFLSETPPSDYERGRAKELTEKYGWDVA